MGSHIFRDFGGEKTLTTVRIFCIKIRKICGKKCLPYLVYGSYYILF